MKSPKESGCCNNLGGGPDFSLLTLPPSVITFDLMGGLALWVVGLAVVVGPFIRSLMKVLACLHIASQRLSGPWTHKLISHCCVVYSVIAYISYHKILQTQPYTTSLQNNQVLALGYIMFLAGVLFKAANYNMLRQRLTLINLTKVSDMDGLGDPSVKNGNGHHNGGGAVWSVLAVAGHALIMARISGVVVSCLLGLSHVTCSLFERYSAHQAGVPPPVVVPWRMEDMIWTGEGRRSGVDTKKHS